MQDVIELNTAQIELALMRYIERQRPGIEVSSVEVTLIPQHGGLRVVAHAKYALLEEDQSDAAADVLGGSGGTASLGDAF